MYRGIIKRWVKSFRFVPRTVLCDDQYSLMLVAKAYVVPGKLEGIPPMERLNRSYVRDSRTALRQVKEPYYTFILHTGQQLTYIGRPPSSTLCGDIVAAVGRYRAWRKQVGCSEDVMPGRMLRRLKAMKRKTLRDDKSPKTAERHIGIEIEFLSPMRRTELEDLLIEAKLEHTCTIKDDGSVEDTDGEGGCDGSQCACASCEDGECCGDCRVDGDNGHEITILTTEKAYKKTLKTVGEVLKEARAWVNSTCGLHVHLDVRQRSSALVYESLVWALPALTKVVPKSRLSNRYCKINTLDERQRDRYYAVNGHSVDAHNTVEVRLHSGTTDPRKIAHWIATLIRLTDKKVFKSLDKPQPQTIGALKAFLPKQTYRYLIGRQRNFGNSNAVELN